MPTTLQIRELRRRTGAGILHCKSALEKTRGNVDQAANRLRLEGIANAETRIARQTTEGRMASYIHHNGRLGAIVELNCETDFVARTDDFAILATQLAEHVAAAAPIAVTRDGIAPELIAEKAQGFEIEVRAAGKPESLVTRIVDGKLAAYFELVVFLEQRWVREPKVKIADLINELASKTGENIQVRRFSRFHMGTA